MLDKAQLFDSLVIKCLADNGLPAEPDRVAGVRKIFQKAGKRIFTPEHRKALSALGVRSRLETVSHAEACEAALSIQGVTNLEQCARAFVAGLSFDLAALRAPLRAFACVANFPEHATGNARSRATCRICGHAVGDLNASSCDADVLCGLQQAGIHGRVTEAHAAARTLAWFATLAPLTPDAAQIARFERMLDIMADAPASATCNSLAKDLSPVLGGDKDSRLFVIETLGYCGILRTTQGEPLLEKWVNRGEILEHPAKFNEAESPACFWKREFGLNAPTFHKLFPMVRLPKSLAAASP
jgi:hypothetical protein